MTTDTLSLTFSALADPTRRQILARLANGELSVTQLAKPFKMTMPAVSKHLKVLERAGLIVRGREGAVASSQIAGCTTEGGCGLGGAVSSKLGRKLRQAGCLPEDHSE